MAMVRQTGIAIIVKARSEESILTIFGECTKRPYARMCRIETNGIVAPVPMRMEIAAQPVAVARRNSQAKKVVTPLLLQVVQYQVLLAKAIRVAVGQKPALLRINLRMAVAG